MAKDIVWQKINVLVSSSKDKCHLFSEASILKPKVNTVWADIVSIIIFFLLLLPSIFIPPLLLLNFPILFFRFAYRQFFYYRAHKLRLSFSCPVCNQTNMETEKSGVLPMELECIKCKAKLVVSEK